MCLKDSFDCDKSMNFFKSWNFTIFGFVKKGCVIILLYLVKLLVY